ncbi:hypothetical protein QQS21_001669 [Conoideocrella luteorostrata]|uniref:N-acetylglucosamine-induced protein 1 n=1 Tax=Conoideocrella luteorostrata TaxID=1105319 RepID=A0AAJ0CXD0_9HYPO|nr:hypothetical protein QQS21_001669 [Conoideocrella luteorostrata]
MSSVESQLPYWQMNVPPKQGTKECPSFLLNLSSKDKGILATSDEDYKRTAWDEVKVIVERHDLASFRRIPSDLRRYLEFKYNIQKKYGSMQAYIQEKRLDWPSFEPSGDEAFKNPEDYKILRNDWPYGIDTDITHLVVWTKFPFEVDPATDMVSQDTRRLIEEFVNATFCSAESGGVDKSNLIWFKNGPSLKSVDGVEHFHVMLYKAREDFITTVTHGDCVMAEMVKDNCMPLGDII